MKAINPENWKYFKVSDIFFTKEIKKYSSIPEANGSIPFVSSTSLNNGVNEYVDAVPVPGNCITVSTNGACFDAFYHDSEICVSTDVEVLYSSRLNEYNGIFIATVLAQEQYRWSFGRKPKNNKVLDTKIKLPVNKTGELDWDYMELYIKEIATKKRDFGTLRGLLKTQNAKRDSAIFFNKWKKFNLSELYDICYGNKFDKNKMTTNDPTINFVSRTGDNNGVDCKVDLVEGVTPFAAGCLTVALGGSIGSCFVQKENFYTGQNLAVLKPKYDKMNVFVNLFISTIIKKECDQKFQAFGRELNKHICNNFFLELPVDDDGRPDWNYMRNIMSELPYGDRIQ